MAWFRRMGVDEVAYHQATVVGRGDDHPGRSLDYYGSRGETPLRWGGSGAERLGLAGEITPDAYAAAFGPGGFTDPLLGRRLVATRRPGFELVVSAHKSVALLGVVGECEAMHAILDTETAATMGWLDRWFQEQGGRRGRAQVRTATSGLTYAVTRHATSRAGDPSPHDHVLVANLVEMLDTKGGHKGLDSAALRDTVEAATMVGRFHSAARAVELGFRIEADPGPSGNLRHWRIAGIPQAVCDLYSKRADEIDAYLAQAGHTGYRARGVAARDTRSVKRHTGADALLPHWQAELTEVGWSVERLAAALDQARTLTPQLPLGLTGTEIDTLAVEVLDAGGELMRRNKVFTRTRLIAELAPRLYGHDPAELDSVIDRVLGSQAVVPLIGLVGAHEQAYATAEVLATEHAIAQTVSRLADRKGPQVDRFEIDAAIRRAQQRLGRVLTAGQVDAIDAVCSSGRAVDVVIGVAGAGKTTALDTARDTLETAGYRVLGTSTSGQAARTLETEAGIVSGTLRSLLWRLDHHHDILDHRTVVVLDEAAMTADADLLRLAVGIERARAKLVLVGDQRQLSAIGPGGAIDALLERHPDIVNTLEENVRQTDPVERAALGELRAGSVPAGVAWYARAGRTAIAPTRTDALAAMVDQWAVDIEAGHRTALLAWRRQDVTDLNRLARTRYDTLGHLHGDDLTTPGGRTYAVGDRVVTLAPNRPAQLVTSQQLTITAIDHERQAITARTEEGRRVELTDEALDKGHLDHAYALTIHRAQGATYDRAHVYADGGGRELGYVAMSRARHRTTLHTVADDLPQAIEDLQTDWGHENRQRWINDTPATIGVRHGQPTHDIAAHHDRLRQERAELEALAPPDPAGRLPDARRRVWSLQQELKDLPYGTGRWRGTEVGHAARAMHEAARQRLQAEGFATSHGNSIRTRHHWRKTARRWTVAEFEATRRYNDIAAPVAQQLEADLARAQIFVGHLDGRASDRDHWLRQHPELERRLVTIERELDPTPTIQQRLQALEVEPPGHSRGLGREL
ncbi:MAG: MobF family relaxase [Acidimicrobiales bacterium]